MQTVNTDSQQTAATAVRFVSGTVAVLLAVAALVYGIAVAMADGPEQAPSTGKAYARVAPETTPPDVRELIVRRLERYR